MEKTLKWVVFVVDEMKNQTDLNKFRHMTTKVCQRYKIKTVYRSNDNKKFVFELKNEQCENSFRTHNGTYIKQFQKLGRLTCEETFDKEDLNLFENVTKEMNTFKETLAGGRKKSVSSDMVKHAFQKKKEKKKRELMATGKQIKKINSVTNNNKKRNNVPSKSRSEHKSKRGLKNTLVKRGVKHGNLKKPETNCSSSDEMETERDNDDDKVTSNVTSSSVEDSSDKRTGQSSGERHNPTNKKESKCVVSYTPSSSKETQNTFGNGNDSEKLDALVYSINSNCDFGVIDTCDQEMEGHIENMNRQVLASIRLKNNQNQQHLIASNNWQTSNIPDGVQETNVANTYVQRSDAVILKCQTNENVWMQFPDPRMSQQHVDPNPHHFQSNTNPNVRPIQHYVDPTFHPNQVNTDPNHQPFQQCGDTNSCQFQPNAVPNYFVSQQYSNVNVPQEFQNPTTCMCQHARTVNIQQHPPHQQHQPHQHQLHHQHYQQCQRQDHQCRQENQQFRLPQNQSNDLHASDNHANVQVMSNREYTVNMAFDSPDLTDMIVKYFDVPGQMMIDSRWKKDQTCCLIISNVASKSNSIISSICNYICDQDGVVEMILKSSNVCFIAMNNINVDDVLWCAGLTSESTTVLPFPRNESIAKVNLKSSNNLNVNFKF